MRIHTTRLTNILTAWAAATAIIMAGNAFAADNLGDAQDQARALLGGRSPVDAHSAAGVEHAPAALSGPPSDPQILAQRLLDRPLVTGRHAYRKDPPRLMVRRGRAPPDAQEMAQQMLLGRRS